MGFFILSISWINQDSATYASAMGRDLATIQFETPTQGFNHFQKFFGLLQVNYNVRDNRDSIWLHEG